MTETEKKKYASQLNTRISEDLMKYLGLTWNAHLHIEKLAHAVFVALTALITGIWTISYTFLQTPAQSIAFIFSSFVSFAGLFLTYKFQGANDLAHVIINRIRKKLGLEDLTVKINNKEIPIFPEWYRKYELVEIRDIRLKSRKGITAGRKWSWWAMYKWIFLITILSGLLMSIYSLF